jgi:hypothetical protein
LEDVLDVLLGDFEKVMAACIGLGAWAVRRSWGMRPSGRTMVFDTAALVSLRAHLLPVKPLTQLSNRDRILPRPADRSE